MPSVTDNMDLSLIGLDNRDKRVYEALYTLERASLRAIADATGLNRGTVYEIIKRLTDVGLVSFTQSGERRHYVAADPGVLISLARERRERLGYFENAAASYARHLKSRDVANQDASYFAAFYEGDEGIATILRDVLMTAESLDPRQYRVLSSQRVSNFIYNNFPTFSRRRIQKDIFVRVIADYPSPEQPVLAERKYLLDGSGELNGYTIIYGSKTALISMSPTNVLSGIVITDEGITSIQRQVFDLLWNS